MLLGCKTVVYESITKRVTWSLHATDTLYIGTGPYHYRYYKPATRSEQIT